MNILFCLIEVSFLLYVMMMICGWLFFIVNSLFFVIVLFWFFIEVVDFIVVRYWLLLFLKVSLEIWFDLIFKVNLLELFSVFIRFLFLCK